MKHFIKTTLLVLAISTNVAMADQQKEATLPEAVKSIMQFMQEEEKLARDVYLTLYDKWEVCTFLVILPMQSSALRIELKA